MKAEESSEETTRISEVIELRVTQVTVMLLEWKGEEGGVPNWEQVMSCHNWG